MKPRRRMSRDPKSRGEGSDCLDDDEQYRANPSIGRGQPSRYRRASPEASGFDEGVIAGAGASSAGKERNSPLGRALGRVVALAEENGTVVAVV